MKPTSLPAALLSALLATSAVAQPPQDDSQPLPQDVLATLAAFDQVATANLWPGFRPSATPLELFDGETTWLVRHPAPPEEFETVAGAPHVARFAGQHDSVRANSSVTLAERVTATMILDDELEPRAQAAVAVHEAFHVFQREQGLNWTANEAELLTYPFEDAKNLQLRLQAEAGLRAALAAEEPPTAMAWAFSALHTERARRELLPPGAAQYERRIELHEGTAQHVQDLARGSPDPWPEEGFGVDGIRRRGYAVGAGLARLLTRFAPGWQERVNAVDGAYLDQVLLAALEEKGARPVPFGHNASLELREQARRAIAAYVDGLVAAREAFLAQPGWKLVVRYGETGRTVVEGFDPMNVRRLAADELLHDRWLRLAGDPGRFEVQRACLSRARGDHPLFQGLRELIVTGLPAKPDVRTEGTTVIVKAEGVTGSFYPAAVDWMEDVLVVTVGEPR